jgi:XAP5 protein.
MRRLHVNAGMRSRQCKKGDDISSFLEKCRQQFPELRGVSVDNLMYVKVGHVPSCSSPESAFT